ncbi:MAG: single-stranded DNA-binding protein [Tidjanibacter sp.]|nr:single-stranded DNA-binding protein [Tidjanibacter sp.]
MVNKVILVGNVGADPEVRTLENGVKTARVRLATTERYRDRNTQEIKEQTEWHTINFWRQLADVVDRFVRKGSQLYVEGSIHTREWTDQSGQKRYSTEITAAEMKLLGRREGSAQGQQGYAPQSAPQSAGQQPAQPQQPATPTPQIDPVDDLPF